MNIKEIGDMFESTRDTITFKEYPYVTITLEEYLKTVRHWVDKDYSGSADILYQMLLEEHVFLAQEADPFAGPDFEEEL